MEDEKDGTTIYATPADELKARIDDIRAQIARDEASAQAGRDTLKAIKESLKGLGRGSGTPRKAGTPRKRKPAVAAKAE